jgi:hypothetical protein
MARTLGLRNSPQLALVGVGGGRGRGRAVGVGAGDYGSVKDVFL